MFIRKVLQYALIQSKLIRFVGIFGSIYFLTKVITYKKLTKKGREFVSYDRD